MQSLPKQSETVTPNTTPICETFDTWAAHGDDRIAQAGAKLREMWCTQGDGHPLTAVLMAHAKMCWRLHFPDGATASALIYDVAALARYIKRLEAQLAALTGGAE